MAFRLNCLNLMTDTFMPAADEIKPIMGLLAMAEITDELRDAAAKEWKRSPPDDEFKNLLKAEVKDE